jgi:protein-disulfide isomerase
LIITRRAFTAALSLTGLAAVAGLSPFRFITDAFADLAADVAKPQSLPDMALGPADAAVTIIEYASLTCSHCAAFNKNVFPQIKAAYIDTGKIRYVLREYPLDGIALAGSKLSRCIAKDDAAKYFALSDLLFRQDWFNGGDQKETLYRVAGQAGLSKPQAEKCIGDQGLQDKMLAGRKYATDVLKVQATPTFFINGEKLQGEASFEEFDKRIKALLKS